MKVIALALTTLCLVAVTPADARYNLECGREEVGIRWPSYYSNSEYYICQNEGGKQLTINCPAGEVFTFVLQSCTKPNRFIPPPPLDNLPTPKPIVSYPQTFGETQSLYPKPIHTQYNENGLRPPVIIQKPTQSWPPVPVPPIMIDEPLQPEIPSGQMTEEEIAGPPSILTLPGKPRPQIPSLSSNHSENQDAPVPPTPAPTPPVVVVAKPSLNKRPPSAANAGKKKPPKPTGKKPAPKPQGKKPPSKSSAKHQAPKPMGKKQNTAKAVKA